VAAAGRWQAADPVRWPTVSAGDAAEELARAHADLAAANAEADDLRRALVTSRQIGMAMGILMERHRLTAEQSFDRLRDLSQRRNVKLRDIAEQLIHTGDAEPRRD
jgi:AmiR/NasT family two-component response regulator